MLPLPQRNHSLIAEALGAWHEVSGLTGFFEGSGRMVESTDWPVWTGTKGSGWT